MKKVENLFPELCNIYGEYYSLEYLRKCNDQIELIQTNHKNEPYFVKNRPDMIYLGCTTEDNQILIIDILKQYKDRIKELIDDNVIFLITGNSIEIFGKYILNKDNKIEGLGLFDFYSKRDMEFRHNSQYVGKFKDEEEFVLLGHRSQFSFSYGEFNDYFVDISIGIGMNKDTKKEGIRKNNFFATYSLGPYLILNPLFTKYLLRKLGLEDKLAFEENIMEAYNYRKNELETKLG